MSASVEREETGVVAPQTEEDVARALREIADRKGTAVPAGRRSRTPRELLPEGAVLLSTERMDRITRFRPDDLTLSAQPGCTLGALIAATERHGLWLPVEVAGGAGRTLGGIFAEGLAGPLAFAFPHPRDLLLGISAVLSDGTRFKTGARVVKNVAGFDLAKLFVGSRGSLLVATELHVRLRPAPRARGFFATEPLPRADAAQVFAALRRPPLALASLTLFSEGTSCRVVAECLDEPAVVDWHAARCVPLTRREVEDEASLRATRARLSFAPAEERSRPATSGSLLPSTVPAFMAALPADVAFAVQGHGGFVLHAHDGLAAAEALGGHGRHGVTRATPRPAAALRLEQGLRRALDPDGVLWPGWLP